MKIEYKTNFEGYFSLLRAIQLIIKDKSLTFTEFGVFICLVAQTDFHKTHETYGVIIRSDSEIAQALGCNSATIFRHRKKLISKRLLLERNDFTVVPNFYLFEHSWASKLAKTPSTYLNELFAKPQDSSAGLQELIAKLQKDQLQNKLQSSSISSKSNLSSIDSSREDIDIDEISDEIDRIEQSSKEGSSAD